MTNRRLGVASATPGCHRREADEDEDEEDEEDEDDD